MTKQIANGNKNGGGNAPSQTTARRPRDDRATTEHALLISALALHPTPRQADLLRHIAQFRRAHGYSPSFRELAGLLGIRSQSVVLFHLADMERAGWITQARNSAGNVLSRTLLLTQAGEFILAELENGQDKKRR